MQESTKGENAMSDNKENYLIEFFTPPKESYSIAALLVEATSHIDAVSKIKAHVSRGSVCIGNKAVPFSSMTVKWSQIKFLKGE